MGDLSQIGPDGRVAVTIRVAPHWADHRFQGRAVLPAVEALQLLAGWVQKLKPGLPVHHLRNASFDKFLELPSSGAIAAWCELREQPDGALRAALLTKSQAKLAKLTRTKIHAQVDFCPPEEVPSPAALDLAAALDGRCFQVAPGDLYRELVPFGPRFQTIARPLLVTAEGALAVIDAPRIRDDQTDPPLGSPLVLDAALHAACVWSQRHAGIVAFPVGFGRRVIVRPTQPGGVYVSRIFPQGERTGMLIFDIWIVDTGGVLFEMLQGVAMRDVSGARLRPPDWVRAGGPDCLGPFADPSAAMVLIERATLMIFAGQCLSPAEMQRTLKMSTKRRMDYCSSRLACKRLFRKLTNDDGRTRATQIHTLAEDGIRPVAGSLDLHCSVAHDRRFTIAAAGEGPLGVDVERLEERILKTLGIFAHDSEQALVAVSPLGALAAAARVWTLKEAAAKMLHIHLADAWARVRVLEIGREHSRVAIEGGPAAASRHVELEDHLITMLYAV